MKTLKKATSIIYWLLVTILILFILATGMTVFDISSGYQTFVVQSGSMEPSIKVGSMVLVAPQKEYKENDIITYLKKDKQSVKDLNATITHRIIEVDEEDGKIFFTTKGDANEDSDIEVVRENQILGQVVVILPLVGYAINFARTQWGFLLLIVAPAVLLVYHEFLNILAEIKKLLKERKEKVSVKKLEEKSIEDGNQKVKDIKKKNVVKGKKIAKKNQ